MIKRKKTIVLAIFLVLFTISVTQVSAYSMCSGNVDVYETITLDYPTSTDYTFAAATSQTASDDGSDKDTYHEAEADINNFVVDVSFTNYYPVQVTAGAVFRLYVWDVSTTAWVMFYENAVGGNVTSGDTVVGQDIIDLSASTEWVDGGFVQSVLTIGVIIGDDVIDHKTFKSFFIVGEEGDNPPYDNNSNGESDSSDNNSGSSDSSDDNTSDSENTTQNEIVDSAIDQVLARLGISRLTVPTWLWIAIIIGIALILLFAVLIFIAVLKYIVS